MSNSHTVLLAVECLEDRRVPSTTPFADVDESALDSEQPLANVVTSRETGEGVVTPSTTDNTTPGNNGTADDPTFSGNQDNTSTGADQPPIIDPDFSGDDEDLLDGDDPVDGTGSTTPDPRAVIRPNDLRQIQPDAHERDTTRLPGLPLRNRGLNSNEPQAFDPDATRLPRSRFALLSGAGNDGEAEAENSPLRRLYDLFFAKLEILASADAGSSDTADGSEDESEERGETEPATVSEAPLATAPEQEETEPLDSPFAAGVNVDASASDPDQAESQVSPWIVMTSAAAAGCVGMRERPRPNDRLVAARRSSP